ncbi:MAG TPA: hypothetical protein VMQ83_01765 [Gammaproteobacteria bacterium]|nr:hypothetical protein [Gammaproteobacteria bacterium]
MSKPLLMVSAAVEVGAGVALLAAPLVIVGLLIGSTLDSPTALAVARLAGAALVTLALVCWFASRDPRSREVTEGPASMDVGAFFFSVMQARKARQSCSPFIMTA